MQKKSLLVALFCGALCLTGCLKNEESASVAQVRIAKANEINSIAELNKAKAQAELIYANAEATIAQAEAKLREANAALVLAQAETEKVRAELLKVRVQLMQVVVDEEKVRLQMLEADLEQKLAEVEAAVAKAESEKAKWIKDLENNIAQAEIQAVNNAKALLKAEAEMADYMLQLEGYKAEQARAASVKYFAAMEQVQTLQKQKIQTLATKALVEAGAKEIRTVIYDAIGNVEEEIAKKEALVENLKKYQKMTPEQVEEAMAAARTQLEETYNAYQKALEEEASLKAAYENLDAEQSLFEANWNTNFTNYVTDKWGDTFTTRHSITLPIIGPISWTTTRYESYVEAVNFVDYPGFEAVTYYGYADPADATKFIKLWKYEPAILTRDVRYPDVTVAKTFNYEVQEGVIAPAEIFYENVDVVLDSILKRKEAQIDKEVKAAEKESAENVKVWQNAIKDNEAALALHQEYVDKRKDTIAKYEGDLATLVDNYNNSQAGHASALDEYLHYMVMNYEVPTSYFEEEIIAAKDTVKASSEYTEAKNKWSEKKAVLETTLTTNKKTAHDNDSIAKKEYNTATTVATQLWTTGGYDVQYSEAAAEWSPFFAGSWKQVSDKGTVEPFYYTYAKGKGTIEHVGKIDSTGTSQKSWLIFKGREEVARLNWEAKKAAYQIDSTTTPKSAVNAAKQEYDNAVTTTESGFLNMEQKRGLFNAQQNVYDYVWGRVTEAEKAWKPEFNELTYKALDFDGKWYKLDGTKKVYAGTAQDAKFMADSLYDAANYQVTGHGTEAKPTLLDVKDAKEGVYTTKKEAWGLKFDALVKALNTTKKDYKADPKVAELYDKTTKTPEAATKYQTKFEQLQTLYGLMTNPEGKYINYIAPVEPAKYVDPSYYSDKFNAPLGFSWLNSNFNLNPEFEYISSVGYDATEGKVVIKKSTVAELIYGSVEEGVEYSLTSINAGLAQDIADEPDALKAEIAEIEDGLSGTATDVAAVRAALKQYKAYESDYKSWVSDRESAFKAWNEAKKERIKAKIAYDENKEIYDGAKIAAEGCMWVYDPDATLYMKVYNVAVKPLVDVEGKWEDGFTKVNVNEAIEMIETGSNDLKDVVKAFRGVATEVVKDAKDLRIDDKDINSIIKKIERVNTKGLFDNIAGLNLIKKVLEETLTQGKVVLQTILEAFDAEIAELEEKIELQSKIAEIYKAVMNGYLGIVEEEDDDEADDEE